MLRSAKELYGWSIHATDGTIGKVYEFLFDDQSWNIRYLVVEAGNWLFGRMVLLSPNVLGYPNESVEFFNVNITREQVKNSPDIDTDKPVYRQHEEELYNYYGWDPYWAMPPMTYLPSSGIYPTPAREEGKAGKASTAKKYDVHLRSTKKLEGYEVRGFDDIAGYVDDCIIEEGPWAVRYIVACAHKYLPGRKVLLSPEWVKRIGWEESIIYADMKAEEIMASPEYDAEKKVDRDFENKLYDYHARRKYWQ